MNIIEVPLNQARFAMREFYNETKHHFIVMNGLDLGNNELEVQWFFCDYADGANVTMFKTKTTMDETLPTIGDFVLSAWPTEAEFVDLFAVKVENRAPGFVLDKGHLEAPLRRN